MVKRPFTVKPRAKNEEDFVICVMGLEGGVFRLRSPHVFLVPPASYFEGGDGDLREMWLHSTRAPELVVGGVVEESLPSGQAGRPRQLACCGKGSGIQEVCVGVFVELGEFCLLRPDKGKLARRSIRLLDSMPRT